MTAALVPLTAALAWFFYGFAMPEVPARAGPHIRKSAQRAQILALLSGAFVAAAVAARGLRPTRGPALAGDMLLSITLALLCASVAHDLWRGRMPYRISRPLVLASVVTGALWQPSWWTAAAAAGIAGLAWFLVYWFNPYFGDADVLIGAASAGLTGFTVRLPVYMFALAICFFLAVGVTALVKRQGTMHARVIGGLGWAFALPAMVSFLLVPATVFPAVHENVSALRLTESQWVRTGQSASAQGRLSPDPAVKSLFWSQTA